MTEEESVQIHFLSLHSGTEQGSGSWREKEKDKDREREETIYFLFSHTDDATRVLFSLSLISEVLLSHDLE